MSNCATIKDIMDLCNAEYLTDGLNSYKTIPDNSVDFIFSNAVLEHIRKKDFLPTFREIKRILCKDGISSHYVDLKDHLNGGLNNLRFSEKIWESDFIYKSGFYTNRIRYSQMLQLFNEANLSYNVMKTYKYDKIPLKRQNLSLEFRNLCNEDLKIREFEVLIR